MWGLAGAVVCLGCDEGEGDKGGGGGGERGGHIKGQQMPITQPASGD
jgi:hypothetical protein